ncbi:MAG TPA: helix-turn-helix transcriptional regulator [Actinomycetota bacterium]|nr:helix-turn-helix transcriptional regulator [Actinomycetota bacterium]
MSREKRAIGEFIRTQRRLARLSLRQLAEVTKVSNAYLSQVERGLYRPSAKVLKALAGALDVSAETLFARAGLLDEPEADEQVDVERAIRLDPRLTDEQKETLLRVYRGFVGVADRPA